MALCIPTSRLPSARDTEMEMARTMARAMAMAMVKADSADSVEPQIGSGVFSADADVVIWWAC